MGASVNEPRRMAYLEALGIESYVSRGQQPGAAPTRRLARRPAAAPVREPVPAPTGGATAVPVDFGLDTPAPAPAAPPRAVRAGTAAPAVRFSLSVILAGRWLWLEQLGDMPLASEQVGLLRAMAIALDFGRPDPRAPAPDIGRFDWPMHSNAQLDNSLEAARAGLGAFLERKITRFQAQGIVALGKGVMELLEPQQLAVPVACVDASAALLSEPARKRAAWKTLQVLR